MPKRVSMTPKPLLAQGRVWDVKVLQWTFAAVPGHPVLRDICEHIKRHADKRLSEDEHYDVLERTGPGPWTDAIMKHTHLHRPSQVRTLLGSHDSAGICKILVNK